MTPAEKTLTQVMDALDAWRGGEDALTTIHSIEGILLAFDRENG